MARIPKLSTVLNNAFQNGKILVSIMLIVKFLCSSMMLQFVVNTARLPNYGLNLYNMYTGLLYSSQAFDKVLWSSNLLLGHADGLGQEGVVVHLGIVAHLDSFIKC